MISKTLFQYYIFYLKSPYVNNHCNIYKFVLNKDSLWFAMKLTKDFNKN